MLSGCRRAAQQRDELAPLHSITSSARRRIERDMVAAAIVDHLRLCNWRMARGPPWGGFAYLGQGQAEWMRRGDVK